MPSPSAAHVSVIIEHVERYGEELVDLARQEQAARRDDVVAAMFEAERALRTAARALRRAAKLAD